MSRYPTANTSGSKSRFIEMFGDVETNSKKWPVKKLGDIAFIKIGPFGSTLHKEDCVVGGHPLVNPSHIVEGNIIIDPELAVSDEKYAELDSYHLHVNDIVMGRRGEMGRCAIVKSDGMLCGTGSLIIRTLGDIKPFFLQRMLSSPTYRAILERNAVGTTMMNLNVDIVSRLDIPILPAEKQDSFWQIVEQADKSGYFN